jgi:hypothetical protein
MDDLEPTGCKIQTTTTSLRWQSYWHGDYAQEATLCICSCQFSRRPATALPALTPATSYRRKIPVNEEPPPPKIHSSSILNTIRGASHANKSVPRTPIPSDPFCETVHSSLQSRDRKILKIASATLGCPIYPEITPPITLKSGTTPCPRKYCHGAELGRFAGPLLAPWQYLNFSETFFSFSTFFQTLPGWFFKEIQTDSHRIDSLDSIRLI